ncbi:craniofacial development protein 2 [Elysia marginata]|uniref:Craniofacial development protein 2 n=1 Tax=Elysia marginata TaxID=1093978 RepID=A0AAV4GH06_9GAST|nr:craniofacial development protein 2 [Elysia marginata]
MLSEKEKKKKHISIENVYGPTTDRVLKNPEELESFYKDLTLTLDSIGKNTILILAGDFNAKIGKRQKGDSCVGSFSKGIRNENGERHLFITNSAFNHASRHITT